MLQLEDGRRVLVSGGTFGIELDRSTSNDGFGRAADRLFLDIDGKAWQVERLEFHVHPLPLGGPSDEDLLVLTILGQDESLLYELFGPPEGTVIRPKPRGAIDGI